MSSFSRALWIITAALLFAFFLDKYGLPTAGPTASLDDVLTTPLRGMVGYIVLSFGVGGAVTLTVKAIRNHFNLF